MKDKLKQKKVISVVEAFYDHSYKRTRSRDIVLFGQERFMNEMDEEAMDDIIEGDYWQPKIFEDIIEPAVVAVDSHERYVVVFGVGASYQVEAPSQYESTGGSFTNNAFALVDMSGRRPVVERFIVGREKDTKIKLLQKYLKSDDFNHFNVRALRKNLSDEFFNMSFIESRDYGRTEIDDPEEYQKMRMLDEAQELREYTRDLLNHPEYPKVGDFIYAKSSRFPRLEVVEIGKEPGTIIVLPTKPRLDGQPVSKSKQRKLFVSLDSRGIKIKGGPRDNAEYTQNKKV